jgi:dsRNA-specific ribonuclease
MASLLLKKMPLEIRRYLLKIQGEKKVQKCVSQYSLELVIYKIIEKQMKEDESKIPS